MNNIDNNKSFLSLSSSGMGLFIGIPAAVFILNFVDIVSSAVTTKVIIDTDGVVDDARALILALKYSSSIDVLAITTTSSAIGVDQATANVKRVLRLLNKQTIAIYKGTNDSIIAREKEGFPLDHGEDGFGDKPNISPYANPTDSQVNTQEKAALALARLAKENSGEITLICLGPLTNIALALKLDPDFKTRLKEVYLVGGTIFGVGNQQDYPSTEYYFKTDPEAAYIVFSEIEVPITVVPWETIRWRGALESWGFLSNHVNMSSFLSKSTSTATFLKGINQDIINAMRSKGQSFRFIDEIAVGVAYDSSVAMRIKSLPAVVELHGWTTRGMVVVDWVNEKAKKINFVTLYDTKKLLSMMEKVVDT